MLEFIKTRGEKHIAIVSHSSYLGYYLHKKIGDEKFDIIIFNVTRKNKTTVKQI